MSETLIYNSNVGPTVGPERQRPSLRPRTACRGLGSAALLGVYLRWLGVWRSVAVAVLRAAAGHGSCTVVVTFGEAPEELFYGFRRVVHVPAELFAGAPDSAGQSESFSPRDGAEELLGCIRALERRCGERFDWDAFSERCEKNERRTRRVLSLARALVPGFLRSAAGLSPEDRLAAVAAAGTGEFKIL